MQKKNSFYSKILGKYLVAYGENVFLEEQNYESGRKLQMPKGLKLFIGLYPKKAQDKGWFMRIPSQLLPSPFNLIYRRLDNKKFVLDADNILITFIDFDVL